jgi:hypothetical protein
MLKELTGEVRFINEKILLFEEVEEIKVFKSQ